MKKILPCNHFSSLINKKIPTSRICHHIFLFYIMSYLLMYKNKQKKKEKKNVYKHSLTWASSDPILKQPKIWVSSDIIKQ
jgi:hypothetical protein